MSEDNTPQDPAPEEGAEVTPPTIDQIRTEAAAMDLDAIKAKHAETKAAFDELQAKDAKTPNDAIQIQRLADEAAVYADAAKAVQAIQSVDSIADIATDPEPTEDEGGEEEVKPAEASGDDVGTQLPQTEPQREPVAAGADGNAGAPATGIGDAKAAASAPFKINSYTGKAIESLADFGQALKESSGGKQRTWIGNHSPLAGMTAGVLGSNADDNYRTIYGDDTVRMFNVDKATGREQADDRSSFTAALNCKGPVQPIQDIPFCYTQGRPLQDSGLISTFEAINGQIQLYGCHSLPEVEGLLQEAADCEDCNDCGESLKCASHQCIEPLKPMEPKPHITCLCVPESLRFSADFVLERALEDFAISTDIAYEQMWLQQLRELSIIRQIDGSLKPEHGAYSTMKRTMLTIKSRLAINPRENCGGLDNYSAFIPGGEALFCAAMMDAMSRVVGCECPGEDILQMLEDTVGSLTFGLDQDPNGPQIAEGFTDTWVDDTVNNPLPLEDPVNAGSVALIPRDSLGLASPLQTEYGIDDRDNCNVHSGCLKLARREWWFDMFQVGCRAPIFADFTNLGTCGTGPDLTACTE